MIYPDDLPGMIEYRMGTYKGVDCIRTTMPRRPVRFVGTSGNTDAAMVCPRIPHGCTGWRRAGETAWRSLDTILREWMPFLDRARASEMDPRPKEREARH